MSDLSAHRSVVLYTYRTHTDSVLTSIPSGAISFCQESYGLPVTQSDLLKKQATCCPPLANFAQLSMFRFDGLIKNHSCFIVNNNSCIYSCFGFIWLYLKGIYFYKRLVLCCKKHHGVVMNSEDQFFAELHPQVVEILGTAVMQVLVEQREPTREALIEMIQVLWQEDDVDLAVELAIDVLRLPKE